jgi:hypothetical protein
MYLYSVQKSSDYSLLETNLCWSQDFKSQYFLIITYTDLHITLIYEK